MQSRIPQVLAVLGILSSVPVALTFVGLLSMVAVVAAERGVGGQPLVHLFQQILSELLESLL